MITLSSFHCILTCELQETVLRDGEVRLQSTLVLMKRLTGVSDMNMDPRDNSIRRLSSSTDEEGSHPDPDVPVDRSGGIGL